MAATLFINRLAQSIRSLDPQAIGNLEAALEEALTTRHRKKER
jgi:hypothetical protein